MTTEKPTRQDWEQGPARCLSKGRAGNARVYALAWQGREVVIKDFGRCPWWIRWTWGRWMVSHEFALLKRLEGVAGVPQGVFRAGAFAFGMELLPGETLGDLNQRNTSIERGKLQGEITYLPASFFRDLERLMCALHRRGVTHLDARNAKNVLVMPGNKPALIDFQSGVGLHRFQPRWVRKLLKLADLSSVYKHYFRYYYDARTKQIPPVPGGFPNNRTLLFLGHLRLRKLWMLKGYAFLQKRKMKDFEAALVAQQPAR